MQNQDPMVQDKHKQTKQMTALGILLEAPVSSKDPASSLPLIEHRREFDQALLH